VLTLLGSPTVELADGRRLPLPATRPGALLAYLACRGDWVARDELAFLMRPDVPDADARRYLRQLLHRAAAFAWVAGLEVVDDRVRWSVASDLMLLREAVAHGGAACLAGAPPAPLLAGYAPPGVPAFVEWLELEREQVAAAWRSAALRHARERERAGDDEAAIEARECVLSAAPLDETTVQALMHACLRSGAAERALEAYERFALALEREVSGAPLEATQALADAARRALAAGQGGGARSVAPRDGLPLPTSVFVGRTHELERLTSWLGGAARLVSIVGLGGAGKTRLALEYAHSVGGDLDLGVRFVPLAGLDSIDEVVAALASRVGLASSVSPTPQAVGAQIGVSTALLVLDEAEHLPPERLGATLVGVLEAAPGLRVIVTSRRPLGVGAEHVLRLGGLAVAASPPGEDDGRASATSDAATLFHQRVSRLGFELPADDATRAVVADLCEAVDGLPLALELAAVQARVRPLPDMVAELRRGADVLRTAADDVPERHRSLDALLSQAWDALSQGQRDALVRLTVFGAGCSLAAADEVAGADVETVATLLERSLLRRVGEDRFEVHALVRRAAPSTPDDTTLDAHARFVLGWLAGLTPALVGGPEQVAVLERVHAALDDVRRAWTRALEIAFGERAGEDFGPIEARHALDAALTALDHALHARSLRDVAFVLYAATVRASEASARGGDAASLRVWSRSQVRLANVERNRGDTEAARSRLVATLDVLEAHGAPVDAARASLEARLELAKVDETVAAYVRAIHGYGGVLDGATARGDDDLTIQAHTGIGNVLFASGGDLERAMQHYDASVALARGVGDRDLLSLVLINLGAGHFDLGRPQAARRAWSEAAELALAIGHRQREAVVLNNLAAVSEALGDTEAARHAFDRSLALRLEVGDRGGAARVLLNLGRLAQRTGALDEADAYLEASVREHEALDDPADLAWALATHARVRTLLGDLRSARRATERALRIGRLSGDRVGTLAALLALAAVLGGSGRRDRAVALVEAVAALSVGRDAGIHASATALCAELRAASAAAETDADGGGVATGDERRDLDDLETLAASVLGEIRR
jgi:predicted ATPase/DNA-binding SARP family transcriptional activator/tetratricopeptide (TPR) repeat protein